MRNACNCVQGKKIIVLKRSSSKTRRVNAYFTPFVITSTYHRMPVC